MVQEPSFIESKNPFSKKEVINWIENIGLSAIKESVKRNCLDASEDRQIAFTEGKFIIKANPKKSNKYLYLSVEFI